MARTFSTLFLTTGETSARRKDNHESEMDAYAVMTNLKWLTVGKVPQLCELFGSQIDDLCGKHSVLIRKTKDRRHSLFFGSIVAAWGVFYSSTDPWKNGQ